MTQKEKYGIIGKVVKSRKGRIRLAAVMSVPIGGSGKTICDICALRNGDCEKIRPQPKEDGVNCLVPEGKLYVYDEVVL